MFPVSQPKSGAGSARPARWIRRRPFPGIRPCRAGVAVAVAVRDGVGGRRFHVDQAPEDRRYACKGRRYGRFEHVSTLPDAVDADGAVASLTDGVFFVDFPKGPEARPKKIGLKTD